MYRPEHTCIAWLEIFEISDATLIQNLPVGLCFGGWFFMLDSEGQVVATTLRSESGQDKADTFSALVLQTTCSLFGWVCATDCGTFLTQAFKCNSSRFQRRPPCIGSGHRGFGQTEPFGSIAKMVIFSGSREASVDFVRIYSSSTRVRIVTLMRLG
jgi:hypothetical protein